jgi:putative CocE/NonD family hydrolase
LKSGVAADPESEALPVRWYTTGENRWKSGPVWPPTAKRSRLYLAAGAALVSTPPASPAGDDRYATDPEAGTGETSRWRGLAVPTWTEYPDRAERDRRLLVYESAVLAHDLEVTGHPIVQLTVRSDQTDGTLFAYLEDVDAKGNVGYVTEGMLRAQMRRVRSAADAPYALNVPYHSFARADAEPLLPGVAAELVFDLLPVSHRFRAGHRVRLAIAGADRDQFAAVPGPPAVWTFERGPGSWLELPVVEAP